MLCFCRRARLNVPCRRQSISLPPIHLLPRSLTLCGNQAGKMLHSGCLIPYSRGARAPSKAPGLPDTPGLTLWRAAHQQPCRPFPGYLLGLTCTPAVRWSRRAAESLIFGWKQHARDPIGEKQHHVYVNVHRADPESGTPGPVLTSNVSRDLLHSSASPSC